MKLTFSDTDKPDAFGRFNEQLYMKTAFSQWWQAPVKGKNRTLGRIWPPERYKKYENWSLKQNGWDVEKN
jgi:hypothetical protein